MSWSLYEGDQKLAPLCFSNGQTQEDVVKNILDAIASGEKVIFVHGVCGTGKSAIALNVARALGKSSVVVPGKNLQTQYQNDYEGKKYLLKDDGTRMNIHVIMGRNNYPCTFLKKNASALPRSRREENTTLNIFEGASYEEGIRPDLTRKEVDKSADNIDLPCKIEIKERNFPKIREYLQKNTHLINPKDFQSVKDVRRMSVASVCPYWSPVLPAELEFKGKIFDGSRKRKYEGLNGQEYIFYERKKGCPYYEQFHSYIDADVIVFNSLKYKIETALNRKPRTEVEIIDECDEFLDSFSGQRTIAVDRCITALAYVFSSEDFAFALKEELLVLLNYFRADQRVINAATTHAIIPLRQTGLYDVIRMLLKTPEFMKEVDEESYMHEVYEIAKMFADYLDETYLTVEKTERDALVVHMVTTNLAKRFQEIVDKNKAIVLMSGTLHSEEVLREIFGLSSFMKIDAETTQQGQVDVLQTGKEMDCKYSNFSSGAYTREDYLVSLNEAIKQAPRPTLVHVNAFSDLPSEEELQRYALPHLISKDHLRELQKEDTTGALVSRFKEGKKDVLFSTRSSRGIDFPGEECRGIVFTKYPNPSVQDSFWRILAQTRPEHYWSFYRDKARRELLQRLYRGLRFKEDRVSVLSPDSRVLDAFREEKIFA